MWYLIMRIILGAIIGGFITAPLANFLWELQL